MNDILEEILTYKREEVEQWKQYIPLKQLYGMMEYGKLDKIEQPSLQLALEKSNTGVIAEFKRKTPLRQWINQGAKASKIPYEFQRGGAVAISIPTDKPCFGGYDEYVQEAKATGVTIPIVYNNFIIDEYQLFQARRVGASAVVLNSLLLSIEQCHSLQSLAHQLGLEVVDIFALTRTFDICELNGISCQEVIQMRVWAVSIRSPSVMIFTAAFVPQ